MREQTADILGILGDVGERRALDRSGIADGCSERVAAEVLSLPLYPELSEELQDTVIDAVRDWGYAPEYVEAMWLMLQQDEPGDFVIATGEQHTVREFTEAAFHYAGLDWERHVEIDPNYFRPAEVHDALFESHADLSRATLRGTSHPNPPADFRLAAGDVRLTVGGEPTFVSIDNQVDPEWTTDADGPHKRERASALTALIKA